MAFVTYAPLVSAGISGLSSIFGGALGSGSAKKANYDARKWQEYMYDFNNWYNKPINQKQRLIEAGLSPSLMYQGAPQNVSNNLPSDPADVSAPAKIKADMFGNIGQAIQQGTNAVIQNDFIRAQTAAILQDIEQKKTTNPIQAAGMSLDNQQKNENIVRTQLENVLKALENQYGNEYYLLRNKGMTLNADQLAKAISYMDENQKLFVKEKLQIILNIAQQTKTLKSQEVKNLSDVERNKTLQALDELERKYRTKGMSFNDFIVFRELKSTFMNFFNGVSQAAGKKNNENTIIQSAAKAIMDLLIK